MAEPAKVAFGNEGEITHLFDGVTLNSVSLTLSVNALQGARLVGPSNSLIGPSSLNAKTDPPTTDTAIGPFPAPPEQEELPDAVWLTDVPMNDPIARFHVCVWLHGDEARMENFWSIVDTPDTFRIGRLGFRSRAARTAFMAWWRRYTERFFDGVDPISCYLPTGFPEGRIKGVFLPDASKLDHLPQDWSANSGRLGSRWSLESGLAEIMPKWGWIAENCKGWVRRVPGGWLFSSARDATLYRMFEPTIGKNS